MGDTEPDLFISESREPWFTQHPRLALAVAGASFVGGFVLRLSVHGDSISMLFVFPVALLALGFGFRAGAIAGMLAGSLLVVWAIVADESVNAVGWLSMLTPLLFLGTLVGAASDRMRAARRAERFAMAVALLQRDTAEINDSVVQGLAATKWLLEAGEVDRAIAALEETAATAQELVTRVLGSESLLAPEVRHPQQVIRRRHPARATE